MLEKVPDEEAYPEDNFFSTLGLSDDWSQVRTDTFNALLEERGGFANVSALDRILLERLSYLYARIRYRETIAGIYDDERQYKSAMTLLSQFIAEVRKADNATRLIELMKADLVDAMVQGTKEAIHDLPPDRQKGVMQNIVKLVDDSMSGIAS